MSLCRRRRSHWVASSVRRQWQNQLRRRGLCRTIILQRHRWNTFRRRCRLALRPGSELFRRLCPASFLHNRNVALFDGVFVVTASYKFLRVKTTMVVCGIGLNCRDLRIRPRTPRPRAVASALIILSSLASANRFREACTTRFLCSPASVAT